MERLGDVMKRLKGYLPAAACAVFLSLCSVAGASPAVESDSFRDAAYDFAGLRTICPLPADMDGLPEIVSLSMPFKAEYWIDGALRSEGLENSFAVKPVADAWRDEWFMYGATHFGNPFESEESEEIFYARLNGVCDAVLKTSITLEIERRWQEPRVEIYWTTESVSSWRPVRRGGGITWVEVERERRVRKERIVPGYWYFAVAAKCGIELYDSKDPNGRYIAAANASGSDSGREGEKAMAERLVKKTVEEAIRALFDESPNDF
jgi:hypothetical protein